MVYVGEIRPEEIFGARAGFTWGGHDKVYLASEEEVAVARFADWNLLRDRDRAFQQIGGVPLRMNKGVIAGGAGLFGIVMELDDGLEVVESNGARFHVDGPVTRWRVFPRSIRYENHLHVVLEDRLEILSFNGELEADQEKKLLGIKYGRSSRRPTNSDSQMGTR
jgi:hypothetical protein